MEDLKVKYRPNKMKGFRGNESIKDSIQYLISKGKLPKALLLTGPRGCGKTTLGRIIANELECNLEHDYTELDSAVFNGIDTVRELRSTILYPPRKGPVKVYLIDEVHMLGQGGDSEKNKPQNAILKSLEEPPAFVQWILCTTDPQRILKTVRDRCTEFAVKPLADETATQYIQKIAKKEKAMIPGSVIEKIVKLSEGRPRSMLSLLSKLAHLDSPKAMKALLKEENLDNDAAIIDLCQAMMKGSKKGGRLDDVNTILRGLRSKDPEKIRRSIMEYATTALLNGNDRASLILGWFCDKPTYDCGFPLVAQYCRNIIKGEQPPC